MTRWSNAPFETRFRTIDGLTIRYAQSPPIYDRQALLLNPWPETILAYEQIWSPLADAAQIIAIDLPGFGRSQRQKSLMSPAAMGQFVLRVADAFGLAHPHLVGPGNATAAALFAASTEPDKLHSLVVGGGPVTLPLGFSGAYKSWLALPDQPLGAADCSDQILADLMGRLQRYTLPDDVLQDYVDSCDGNRLVEATEYFRACSTQLPLLRDLLPTIQTPVKIICGKHDDLVPPAHATFLHSQLPNSSLELLEAGHLVWEDEAAAYAAAVLRWWNANRGSKHRR